MSLGEQLDLYCERGSAAFWSEPANALTNLAFILAALAVWRMLRKEANVPTSIAFMPPLIVLIGVGSFAFHTLATRWALVLDVGPIGLFVLWYLASFLRWFYGLTWRRCLLGVLAFACLGGAFAVLTSDVIPNRSATYVPVLLLMLGLSAALRLSAEASRARYWPAFAMAGAVFAAALLARTMDMEICGDLSLGTHFLWHLLNGCLTFVVARPLIGRWRDQVGTQRARGR
jgi:ceramidase